MSECTIRRLQEAECSRGSCGTGVNPSRSAQYQLQCSNDECAAVFPLTRELNDLQVCPKCRSGILIWVPKEREG
jgi:hypothetical protein